MPVVYFPGGPTTDSVIVPWPGPPPEPVAPRPRIVILRVPIEQGTASGTFGFTATASGVVPGVLTVTRSIAAGSDDAQEPPSLPPQLAEANHLADLVDDQFGTRFTDLPFQQGATISQAVVTQTLLNSSKNDAEGTWFGHDIDDSATFTTTDGDITGRAHTTASVPWTANDLGVLGDAVASPNLATIIQEIVDRPGWQPGNSISLIYVHNSSTDKIEVATLENTTYPAATLYVEYRLIPQVTGVGVGFFGFTGAASGLVTGAVTGVATGLFGFSGVATGIPRVRGVGTGAFGFTGVATGIRRTAGTGAGTFGFGGTALGVPRVRGAASGSFGFMGLANGTPRVRGAATGLFGFTGTAQGVIPSDVVTGVGVGAFGFAGAATGRVSVYGVATGSFGFSGLAAGRPRVVGVGSGLYGFTATATGKVIVHGQGLGLFGGTFTAAGFAGERVTPPERIIPVADEQRTLTVPSETRTLVNL